MKDQILLSDDSFSPSLWFRLWSRQKKWIISRRWDSDSGYALGFYVTLPPWRQVDDIRHHLQVQSSTSNLQQALWSLALRCSATSANHVSLIHVRRHSWPHHRVSAGLVLLLVPNDGTSQCRKILWSLTSNRAVQVFRLNSNAPGSPGVLLKAVFSWRNRIAAFPWQRVVSKYCCASK